MSAEARMMDSQTRAAESQAKTAMDMARLQAELGQGGADPAKMMDLQVRQNEITQKEQDTMLDAINRKRDRESRERLAAMRMAEQVAQNPQSLGLINQIIDPEMLKRLEGNEPSLDGTQTGEL